MKTTAILVLWLYSIIAFAQNDTLVTMYDVEGIEIMIEFKKGPHHNHPLMAFWIEDSDSNYIETLFVVKSIGTSVFGYGDKSGGAWKPGLVRRPAALPYWSHKRGIMADDGFFLPTPDNPMPDAISGPTPKNDFVLFTNIPYIGTDTLRLLMEINQSWDWNEYWTNDKYPDDEHYKTSSQPSVVYEAVLTLANMGKEISLVPVGHGHYSGKDGKLYSNLQSLSTALEIVKELKVMILNY